MTRTETKDGDLEYELKLAAQPEVLIAAFDQLDGEPAAGKPTRLRAVYYDTADRRLARNGAGLRVRHEGTRFVQTLKVERGPLERTEHKADLPGSTPNLDALPNGTLAAAAGAVFPEELAPVFATDVQRRTREIAVATPGNGDGRVEIALDIGEIRAGEASEPVAELELELIGGHRHAVFAVAETLVETGAVRLVTPSKAERGYRLADGGAPPYAKAGRLELARELTVADGLAAILTNTFDQIWANHEAALDGRDPEGVHQLRVAIRRLRSALTLFRPVLDERRRAALNDEARWVMAALGPARDLDVFATETLPPVAGARPNDAALAAVRATAEDARERAYKELRNTLGDARYTRFMLALASWIDRRGWFDDVDGSGQLRLAEPLGAFADRVLAKRAKAVRKRGKHFEELDAPERHEVRKTLKKLRYACDFLRGLYAEKATKPYLKRLSSLQDDFGHMNDMATAEALLDDLVDPSEPRLAAGRGLVLGWYAHAAAAGEAELVRDWHAFNEARPFWGGTKAC